MSNQPTSYLTTVYDYFREIETETIQTLGRENALYFVDLANDWIDIHRAISQSYAQDEQLRSLTFFYFTYVMKEVNWLQVHFSCGNYPLLGHSLRFLWEMIYRGYHVDSYTGNNPPGQTLDLKIHWLEQRKLNWRNCIGPVLGKVFPLAAQEKNAAERYYALWQTLNSYVHPSADLFSKLVGESALLATDRFDAAWATEILAMATQVFDVIWLALLSRFPRTALLLAQNEHGLVCPLTQMIVEKCGDAEPVD